jgi:hypothetical protein
VILVPPDAEEVETMRLLEWFFFDAILIHCMGDGQWDGNIAAMVGTTTAKVLLRVPPILSKTKQVPVGVLTSNHYG